MQVVVEKPVEVIREVEKRVEVVREVEKIVFRDRPVEKLVEVEKIVYRQQPVKVLVEVVKEIERIVEVEKPVEVVTEVVREVMVEKPVEVVREIEVEKRVEVEVEKVVEVVREVEKPVEVVREVAVCNRKPSVENMPVLYHKRRTRVSALRPKGSHGKAPAAAGKTAPHASEAAPGEKGPCQLCGLMVYDNQARAKAESLATSYVHLSCYEARKRAGGSARAGVGMSGASQLESGLTSLKSMPSAEGDSSDLLTHRILNESDDGSRSRSLLSDSSSRGDSRAYTQEKSLVDSREQHVKGGPNARPHSEGHARPSCEYDARSGDSDASVQFAIKSGEERVQVEADKPVEVVREVERVVHRDRPASDAAEQEEKERALHRLQEENAVLLDDNRKLTLDHKKLLLEKERIKSELEQMMTCGTQQAHRPLTSISEARALLGQVEEELERLMEDVQEAQTAAAVSAVAAAAAAEAVRGARQLMPGSKSHDGMSGDSADGGSLRAEVQALLKETTEAAEQHHKAQQQSTLGWAVTHAHPQLQDQSDIRSDPPTTDESAAVSRLLKLLSSSQPVAGGHSGCVSVDLIDLGFDEPQVEPDVGAGASGARCLFDQPSALERTSCRTDDKSVFLPASVQTDLTSLLGPMHTQEQQAAALAEPAAAAVQTALNATHTPWRSSSSLESAIDNPDTRFAEQQGPGTAIFQRHHEVSPADARA